MIISKTPLRVSFFGGGTDFSDFYELEEGAVLSSAINKYIFITLNRKFDNHIRISYSKTELVKKVDEIKHNLVREAMKLTGVDQGIEITSIADIPSHGTGIGSSSSFTVGLLNALYAYKGIPASPEKLASDASKVEIDIVGEPIGKQDQYIAAYGGFKFIQFYKDGSVSVSPVVCTHEMQQKLKRNLMLFYTGITRRANNILSEQKKKSGNQKREDLKVVKQLAFDAKDVLIKGESIDSFGELLDQGWNIKRGLASGITNAAIDEIYIKAKKAGALGGKVTGAGGGGFMLFYVPEKKHNSVRAALSNLKELNIGFEPLGTQIIYKEN